MQPSNIKIQLLTFALIALIFSACEDDRVTLNKSKRQVFEGSFTVTTNDNTVDESATSTLEISDGRFKGLTYNGSILAAGRLTVTESKIIFTDTVFKIYPANILPPRCLNGTYDYTFDGNKLQIGNKYPSGGVELHTLYLKK